MRFCLRRDIDPIDEKMVRFLNAEIDLLTHSWSVRDLWEGSKIRREKNFIDKNRITFFLKKTDFWSFWVIFPFFDNIILSVTSVVTFFKRIAIINCVQKPPLLGVF